VHSVESRSDLKDVFATKYHIRHPKMQNSMCSRELLNEVRKQLGRVFIPSCPDYSSCVAILALTERYAFIDEPLYIAGSANESIGAAGLYFRGEALDQFFAEFGDEDVFGHVPLKLPLAANNVAESILKVKEKMSYALADVSFDWERYFVECYAQIIQLQHRGVDIAPDKDEFFAVLSGQPEALQTLVRETIMSWAPPIDSRKGITGYLRRAARGMIERSTFLANVESRLRYGKAVGNTGTTQEPLWPLLFRGEDQGFSNILECSIGLEKIFRGLQVSGI
jgi:hypothetical protein